MSRVRRWAGLRASTNAWPIKPLKVAARNLCVRVGYHSSPSFIIVGAQKAGTTALLHYLSNHPRIAAPVLKEAHFFDVDPLYYGKGLGWYHRNFVLPHDLPTGGATGEATPEYLYYPAIPERLQRYNPQLKLIALIREPVGRAYSAWNMFRQHHADGRDKLLRELSPYQAEVREGLYRLLSEPTFPSFEQVVMNELDAIAKGSHELEPSFVRRGLYAEQLRRYFARFPREQLLVIDSRDLRHRLHETLGTVTTFLGQPAFDWSSVELGSVHERTYDAKMPEGVAARLRDFYRPHNLALEELIGRELAW